MRDITVCKFGGSSLADAECFRRVGDIIHSDSRRQCIVVSAPGKRSPGDIKVTDLLISAWNSAGEARLAAINSVRAKFCRIAMDLGLQPPYSALYRLKAYIRQGRDAIASRGEYLSAMLLAEYLALPFIDAAELFIFRSGALDIGATYSNLRSIDVPCVIPGFYGSDETGAIVTFPRGGSDISAAHVAAALGADLYENWTDVNGFYTADPAIVTDALPIPHLSCSQAQLFTYLGAGVLHYESVAPAAEAGVPIIIKNTFSPDAPGTLITPGAAGDMPCVASKRLSGDAYLLSCANLAPHLAGNFSSAVPLERHIMEYGGTYSVECTAGELHTLTAAIHAACIGQPAISRCREV